MASGRYRAVFHTDLSAGNAFTVAKDQIRGWLRCNRLDVEAFDEGLAQVGKRKELLQRASNASDGTRTRLWQLREYGPKGYRLSSLIVHAPGRTNGSVRSWFWLDTEFFLKNSMPSIEVPEKRAEVPHFVYRLLDAVDAYDSLMVLRGMPRLIRPDDVNGLIDVLCDPDRRLPAIVASAHPRIEFEQWRQNIELATRFAVGLAGIYILDPSATDAFNTQIGDTHGARDGEVRTYLPEVDPAVASDARRHRVVSAATIKTDPGRAYRALAVLPRELAADAPLPDPLARIPRSAFLQEREAGEPQSAPEVERVREDLDAALQLLDEAGRTEAHLRNRLAELQDDLLESTAELELANDTISSQENQLRYLSTRLAKAGQGDSSPAEMVIQEILPKSFSEIFDRLPKLKFIDFTGDHDVTLDLENKAQYSVWAQQAWQAFLALNSYAERRVSGRFRRDFVTWCKEPPCDGHSIGIAKVARDESVTVRTNPKMRRYRELPVPEKVNSAGKAFMGAHIRIGGGNTVAPRLHFYDDASRTGKIYVGYLGRHLPNTKTT